MSSWTFDSVYCESPYICVSFCTLSSWIPSWIPTRSLWDASKILLWECKRGSPLLGFCMKLKTEACQKPNRCQPTAGGPHRSQLITPSHNPLHHNSKSSAAWGDITITVHCVSLERKCLKCFEHSSELHCSGNKPCLMTNIVCTLFYLTVFVLSVLEHLSNQIYPDILWRCWETRYLKFAEPSEKTVKNSLYDFFDIKL